MTEQKKREKPKKSKTTKSDRTVQIIAIPESEMSAKMKDAQRRVWQMIVDAVLEAEGRDERDAGKS